MLEAWLGRVSKAWTVPITSYNIPGIISRFFFVLEKKSAEGGLSRLYSRPPVSLKRAASDTARPALLMGGRRESAAIIVVLSPGMSSSVGRVLGNRDVEGRRCSSFVLNLNREGMWEYLRRTARTAV